jgi:hypothetical protein
MKKILNLKLLLTALIVVSCLNIKAANVHGAFLPDLQWDFARGPIDNIGTPSVTVSLLVDGKKYELGSEIGEFSNIEKGNFRDYRIPKKALIGCQGWWAGAGVNYWVIKKGNNLVVMKRDISEGHYGGKGYKVMTIPI